MLFAVQVAWVSDSSWCFTVDLKQSESGLLFSCMNLAERDCLFPFLGGEIDLGLYCKPLFSSDLAHLSLCNEQAEDSLYYFYLSYFSLG